MITFLVQGIRPATWREKERAAIATRTAIGLRAGVSAVAARLIVSLRKG